MFIRASSVSDSHHASVASNILDIIVNVWTSSRLIIALYEYTITCAVVSSPSSRASTHIWCHTQKWLTTVATCCCRVEKLPVNSRWYTDKKKTYANTILHFSSIQQGRHTHLVPHIGMAHHSCYIQLKNMQRDIISPVTDKVHLTYANTVLHSPSIHHSIPSHCGILDEYVTPPLMSIVSCKTIIVKNGTI